MKNGKTKSVADVQPASTGSTQANDVCVVLSAPVANVLKNRCQRHGMNADQYLWQLMKWHDLKS